ncbi:MAG: NAD(P)(+) transhydrogenase (Re/Si-specific) subunit beta [Deltaproteobacteria bacterium]|nr:NAD(P)(+) transhydrogenase (Re/Si-specific) subunit beta [Deltaproteobacteria bacterium]
MSEASLQTLAYLVAAILFILSLRGLSNQESARRGNAFGAIGMLIAVLVTGIALFSENHADSAALGESAGWLGGAIAVGAIIGAVLATRVAMTSMPELTAILHSFVGAAAVLVGIANYLGSEPTGPLAGLKKMFAEAPDTAHLVEIYVGVFVGAVTFTGSVIAFFKLRGTIGSKPLVLPGRHLVNAIMLLGSVALGVLFVQAHGTDGVVPLVGMTAIACVLGAHLVMAIGGGDMPVVVSLLNSYSGWAAAAAGFMLNNDLLIITGALVGSSGAILSYIMCKAMNRSIWNVVFGGFGNAPAPSAKGAAQPQGTVTETNIDGTAQMLQAARSVIVVPGYGMAVAQAQHAVKEITSALAERGCKVAYAIHPVAGRLPGHMNVLLAEAGVSYDIVHEMEEINDDFEKTDVVLVIGANDIVNPSALEDASSPIYGMPVLEAWKAAKVVMLKRSMNAGYAGVDNPLAYRENTVMLFGDAKATVNKLLEALRKTGTQAAA